jgi:hypothetical protein
MQKHKVAITAVVIAFLSKLIVVLLSNTLTQTNRKR